LPAIKKYAFKAIRAISKNEIKNKNDLKMSVFLLIINSTRTNKKTVPTPIKNGKTQKIF
jgi:hypothetical protein